MLTENASKENGLVSAYSLTLRILLGPFASAAVAAAGWLLLLLDVCSGCGAGLMKGPAQLLNSGDVLSEVCRWPLHVAFQTTISASSCSSGLPCTQNQQP